MKSVVDINPTTKRRYIDYYLLEVTFYRLRVPRKILPQITQIYTDTESSIKNTNNLWESVKSVGDINPTTKRSYTDYYLLEITFHRLYRFTQIFKAHNIYILISNDRKRDYI